MAQRAGKSDTTVKIGLISDTHTFLDPRVPRLLAGVVHILHAGDIGLPKLIVELERIAPVTAVSGNTDDPGFHWRPTELVALGSRKFLLQHIANPRSPDPALLTRMQREQPDVVVFGHTHKPFCESINGVLFLNPGYAGKSRFGLPRTIAVLHCGPKLLRAEYFPL